jgi:CBS domain containing-hemolysin-like protein
MATKIAIEWFGSNAVGITVGIMTLLILIFGEITPKAFAAVHPVRIALLVAPIFKVLLLLFLPLTKMFDFINVLVHKGMGSKKMPLITEEEIAILVEYGEKAGAIKQTEREMIQNVFKFDNIAVKEVMTPRTDVVFIEASKTLREGVDIFAQYNYSRLPVYKDRMDNIIGILYVKDVMNLIKNNDLDTVVENLVKPVYFVPKAMSVDVLFRQFQKRKMQMAIVVDEYGGISGLVTLEDLLEEIVGEIFDETEKIDPHIKQVDANTWLVKGSTDIEKVNEKLGIAIEDKETFETISGHILDIARKIPEVEEKFEDKQAVYTVLKTAKNRISLIKVEKK